MMRIRRAWMETLPFLVILLPWVTSNRTEVTKVKLGSLSFSEIWKQRSFEITYVLLPDTVRSINISFPTEENNYAGTKPLLDNTTECSSITLGTNRNSKSCHISTNPKNPVRLHLNYSEPLLTVTIYPEQRKIFLQMNPNKGRYLDIRPKDTRNEQWKNNIILVYRHYPLETDSSPEQPTENNSDIKMYLLIVISVLVAVVILIAGTLCFLKIFKKKAQSPERKVIMKDIAVAEEDNVYETISIP
ncbi:uncharacterized protein LOC143027044 [Oratosquilla oratoria]|uniref:uncharacterized protein LOC143027044 n=1 Tax=Oratosquilla oratoria TaxID=337810 RepID=UPI003F761418